MTRKTINTEAERLLWLKKNAAFSFGNLINFKSGKKTWQCSIVR